MKIKKLKYIYSLKKKDFFSVIGKYIIHNTTTFRYEILLENEDEILFCIYDTTIFCEIHRENKISGFHGKKIHYYLFYLYFIK